MSEAMPWQPEQSFAQGRFVLVKRLGRGGMGEVWLARDERLGEPVALKFLPQEIRGDPGALDDLRRETARSHLLSHPNIVRIHDLFEDPDGMAFIVMEYVDGPTLAALRIQQPSRVLPLEPNVPQLRHVSTLRLQRRSGLLSWDYLRPLLAQLCAALDYAHEEKVIHRDLKPANLMVDSRGRLKLADFGIAAAASDSMSRISVRHSNSGTLPYMSPQQVAGKRPQATDDIYALGATLYELLTSKLPFHSGDITHQILHEAPEPMEDRLAALGKENDIPPAAAALIMACLAKEPGRRPQSARVVAEWIGLELEVIPSTESLAAALSPETPSNPGAVSGKPAGESRSKPARFGRDMAAVVVVVLVMATAFWLRKDILLHDHSNASVAVEVPAQTEPANGLKAPPAGAPPEAAMPPQDTTTSPSIPTERRSNAPVASKVPAQSAPASEQHTPPAGALLPPASKQAAGTQPGVKQPSTRLTAGMLWNKTFLFRRVSAPDAPASYPTENIATLTLRKDGTIAGSISLNESFWLIDSDGHLVFKHRDGRLSTIFTLAEQRGGKSFFSGTFLFLKGIQHFLDER